MQKAVPYSDAALSGGNSQRTFSGKTALQVALPLGGIGAGCICMNGYGGLQDFSIRNRPETKALPDGHSSRDTAFAVLHVKGRNAVTKLVEGPLPVEKIYNLGLKGQGHREGGHEGLPRFEQCSFKGEYPFGYAILTDAKIPLKLTIRGFNPFVPLDDRNSGIPCAILEYTLENRSSDKVDYEFSFHVSHLAPGSPGRDEDPSRNSVIPGAGVFFHNTEDPTAEAFGSASLTVVGHRPLIKAAWHRGGWWDALSVLWREVSTGTFRRNTGVGSEGAGGRNGGSILLRGELGAGARATYPIVITWHFPNSNLSSGQASAPNACENCGSDGGAESPKWRPYYASQWKEARDVAAHVRGNYDSLRSRTEAFHGALFSSTLPVYVLDAVSANLAILKSPTVLRQENGNVWAWEGCFSDSGCCPGSCTHVWNYAQAMPHLYPQLERTLREQELERSLDEKGHVTFRAALPDGPTAHTHHATSGGQLGGILKVYRHWHTTGDRDWLNRMYPLARKSIDYAIRTWDPRHTGVLQEPHHNTYDIEFWGPESMCSSIYVAALGSVAELARDVGNPEDAPFYEGLARKGARYLDRRLFNGEYYEQKVTYRGLRDTSFQKFVAKVTRKSSEEHKLLKRDGPKYQYGSGCLSDSLIGFWMAGMYGIDVPVKAINIRRSLKAIFHYNFRKDLNDHTCTQRPGYALGHEAGLLLCSWPRGGRPMLPFVYSDEVWTGIEYQVASHMISEGLVSEGLTIVKAARDRHNGHVRNPWNEYECGNYYARAMSSYALLGALSGFRYSRAKRTLWLNPRLKADRFRIFFSAATGFGTLTLSRKSLTIEMVEGKLEVDTVYLARNGKQVRIDRHVVARPGARTILRGLSRRSPLPGADGKLLSDAEVDHIGTFARDFKIVLEGMHLDRRAVSPARPVLPNLG